jgi:hypothetical protein
MINSGVRNGISQLNNLGCKGGAKFIADQTAIDDLDEPTSSAYAPNGFSNFMVAGTASLGKGNWMGRYPVNIPAGTKLKSAKLSKINIFFAQNTPSLEVYAELNNNSSILANSNVSRDWTLTTAFDDVSAELPVSGTNITIDITNCVQELLDAYPKENLQFINLMIEGSGEPANTYRVLNNSTEHANYVRTNGIYLDINF